jgi:hypothetical protein
VKRVYKNIFHLVVLISFLVSLMVFVPAGQGSVSPPSPQLEDSAYLGLEYQISPTQNPDADRYLPAVAYNSLHDQYLVVWHNQWSGSRDIYGQRLAYNGQPVGPWFSVSSGANDRMAPAVAYNATDHEYLVVYMYDVSTNGTRHDIMGQRVRWDGVLLGSQFQINTTLDTDHYAPRVIWKEAYNEYLVIWGNKDATTGVPNGIGLRLIDNLGGTRYATIVASSDQPTDPDVIWEPAFDRYLVVWTYTNASGHTAIMGDLRDGNANRVGGSPFVIYSSSTEDVLHPRAASNGIYFFSVYEYVYSPSDHDIKGAWITSDASVILPVTLVDSLASETLPGVASNPGQYEIMVLFQRLSGSQQEVWAHPISNTMPATDIPVCKYDYWNCISPAGVWGNPGYVLVYSARYTPIGGTKYYVYGRILLTNSIYVPIVQK